MRLDEDKFEPDESLSTHAVQAVSHPDCPLQEKRACFSIATGLGGKMRACEHLDRKKPICHYGEGAADERQGI